MEYKRIVKTTQSDAQDLRDWWTKIENIDAMQKRGATWAMAASYREIAISLLGELEQEKGVFHSSLNYRS